MLIKKLGLSLALVMLSTTAFSDQLNGEGLIEAMYMYPDRAVIVQGNKTPGPSNCKDDNNWSFNWSSFDAAAQGRIQSMLLTAYTMKTPIQISVSSTGCGPGGTKLFTGFIHLP